MYALITACRGTSFRAGKEPDSVPVTVSILKSVLPVQGEFSMGDFNVTLLECVTAAWELALEVLVERRQEDLHKLVPPCKALAEAGGPALQPALQVHPAAVCRHLAPCLTCVMNRINPACAW